MAFRKRNIALNKPGPEPGAPSSSILPSQSAKGTRPSPLTSTLVTSTGTSELDGLLGGHGGLVLGSSLLIGEHGTTDFAGALLRAFAAEGALQGHVVHVVGVGKGWESQLPGVVDGGHKKRDTSDNGDQARDKMKIAWRYESMSRAGERVVPARTSPSPSIPMQHVEAEVPFNHSFDLTKRLELPSKARFHHIPISSAENPLLSILDSLDKSLSAEPASSVHRIVIPLLLSPALYPPNASKPEQILRFMHGLKALLSRHKGQVTAMLTLPLSLYSRTSGLVRWMEHLSDGVLELLPFPYLDTGGETASGGKDERLQGLLKVLKLPLTTERGEGGAGVGNSIGEDLAFSQGRKRFTIKPFSLPPMEGDEEAQKEAGKVTAKDVEF